MVAKNNNYYATIILIAFLALALLSHYQATTPLNQEIQSVICSSGTCSDSSISRTTNVDLSRQSIIGGAVCDESKSAEGYIPQTHSYDKYYLFNRDGESNNNAFNEEIGAHSGIRYVLYEWNPVEQLYEDTGDVKEIVYGGNGYFELEDGKQYRIDVYYCDTPSQLAFCEEGDNGLNEEEKSLATSYFGVFEDRCLSSDELKEYYCEPDGSINSKTIDCSADSKICSEGACVNKPIYEQTKYLIAGIISLLLITTLIVVNKRRKTRSFGRDNLLKK